MIIKNKLLNNKNLVIYQDSESFNFSLDSVLLADFVTITGKENKIIDLCGGNAPITMLLSQKTKANLYSVELQSKIHCLAQMSIMENNLNTQITLINEDVKNIKSRFNSDEFDIVTCNPPYFKQQSSQINKNEIKAQARHELTITLEEIVSVARKIIKNKGKFYMVHRTERLLEILELLRKNGLEPKKLKFIYPKNNCSSNIVLIMAMKQGHPGLVVVPPLIIHHQDGNYQDIIKEMYGDKNVAN